MGSRRAFREFLNDAEWRELSEFPAYIEEYGGFAYDGDLDHYLHEASGLSVRLDPDESRLLIEAPAFIDRAYARVMLPYSVPLKTSDPDRHVFLYRVNDEYHDLLQHMLDRDVDRGELRKTWTSGVYYPVDETRKRGTAEIHAEPHNEVGWGRREFPVEDGQIAVLIQQTPIDPAIADHIDHIAATLPLVKHIHYTATWGEFFKDDTNVDEWLEETQP